MGDLENGLLKISEIVKKSYNEIKSVNDMKRMSKSLSLPAENRNRKKIGLLKDIKYNVRFNLFEILKEILDEDEIDTIINELNDKFNKNEEYTNKVLEYYEDEKNSYYRLYGFELKDKLNEDIIKYYLIEKYLLNEYKLVELVCEYICYKHNVIYHNE